MTDTDHAAARQAALAAELRALYGYALIGPRVSSGDVALVRACIAAHTTLRDETVAALEAGGTTPVSPLADYPDLYPVTDAADARTRAVQLEEGCATAWRYLYSQLARTPGGQGLRAAAQQGLTASAVRATRWRLRSSATHPTVAFPGI